MQQQPTAEPTPRTSAPAQSRGFDRPAQREQRTAPQAAPPARMERPAAAPPENPGFGRETAQPQTKPKEEKPREEKPKEEKPKDERRFH